MWLIRFFAKSIAWTLGSILAIVAVLFFSLVFVNWNDKDPSAAARKLERLYKERPQVADDDNGFIYLLGMAAPPDRDPQAVGVERFRWLENAMTPELLVLEGPVLGDPLTDPVEFEKELDREFVALRSACGVGQKLCEAVFDESKPLFAGWLRNNQLLSSRYRQLIARSDWRQVSPSSSNAERAPDYALVSIGQWLYVLEARERVLQGDFALANQMISADLRYWRHVLESSDSHINKAMAAIAAKRHFALVMLASRELPRERIAQFIPDSWGEELSQSERSMQRAFVGEWAYGRLILQHTMLELEKTSFWDDRPWSQKAYDVFLSPLFNIQDTLNKSAETYVAAIEAVEVPIHQLPRGVEAVDALVKRTEDQAASLTQAYNPVGALISALNNPTASYAFRAVDVEGVRRMSLAVLQMRERRVTEQDAQAFLAASEYRNPYTNEAFEWDAENKAVVFKGMQNSAAGVHRIGVR